MLLTVIHSSYCKDKLLYSYIIIQSCSGERSQGVAAEDQRQVEDQRERTTQDKYKER